MAFIRSLFSEVTALLSLAIPIMVSQAAFISLELIDGIFAGHISPTALAVLSVSNSFLLPLLLFVFGTHMILTPVVSYHFGSGNLIDMQKSVIAMMQIGFVLGLVLSLCLYFSSFFFSLFHVDPTLIPLASSYLKIRAIGMVPLTTLICIRFFFDGLSNPKPFLLISLICIPIHVFFLLLFQHGFWIVPSLGLFGIALSTCLVDLFLVLFLVLMTYHPSYPLFRLPYRLFFSKLNFISLLKLSIPSGLSLAAEVSMFCLAGLFLGALSLVDVSAHHIAFSVSALTYMIPFGISAALSSRIGLLRGRLSSLKTLKLTVFSGLLICFLCTATSGLFLVSYYAPIIQLYAPSESVFNLTKHLFIVVALYQLFDGFQVCLNGILKGFQDTQTPMILMLLSYWGVGFLSGYTLAFILGYGALGFWIGIGFGFFVCMILLSFRLRFVFQRLTHLRCHSPSIKSTH